MDEKKTPISLVREPEKEVCGFCDWCGEPLYEDGIYKVRGDYICRTCVEQIYENRES